MKNDRIKRTENEKLVYNLAPEGEAFNMKSDKLVGEELEKARTERFNQEVQEREEKMKKHEEELEKIQTSLKYSVDTAEIKPMFSRIIVKPFKQNPFQKMKIEGGIIIETGTFAVPQGVNPKTGQLEDLNEFIVTGLVVEVGPEVKYLQEGDVVYFRKDTTVPVPFFSAGLISINENQVISVVNENLTKRFNDANGK